MRTRGLVAAGLCVAAAHATPARAQENPPPPGAGIPAPPPADRPLIREVPRPTGLLLDGGMGVLGFISGTGRVGPAWTVRFTADFSRRFAAEAAYTGSVNTRADNTGSLVYTALDGTLRYNILRADEAPVQPYVSAGLGWSAWIGPGGTPFSIGVPLAAGVERMLTDRVKIGARLQVRPTFFDDLGHGEEANPPGGDSWMLSVNAGGAF